MLPIDMQCKRRIDQMRLIQKGVINTEQPKQHVKKLKSLALLWFSYYFTTISYYHINYETESHLS